MGKGTHPAIVFDAKRKIWRHFSDPVKIYTSSDAIEILPILNAIEEEVSNSKTFAIGFLSYEAAQAFIPKFKPDTNPKFPLIWFGIYTEPIDTPSLREAEDQFHLGVWHPDMNKKEYAKAFKTIKEQIETGYTYQANLTFRFRNSLRGDPYSLFVNMVRAQGTSFGAYIDTGELIICSASPELFFTRYGKLITSRPMKGTSPRGKTYTEDLEKIHELRSSVKNRAENIMIVDMIRNDIGRIATTGSVKANPLFKIEKFPTLFQMTSTVKGQTKASIPEIFNALFPCASITGAPKISTMKIIADCEKSPRNVYTGAIGFIEPNLDCQFNVAIRTAIYNKKTQGLEYGVGGGIVWDSELGSEYDEAILKADVIRRKTVSFSVKESILWDPNFGHFLLERHIQRLAKSCAYFGIPFEKKIFNQKLHQLTANFPNLPIKIRLEVQRSGEMMFEYESISGQTNTEPVLLKLADFPVNSSNTFLYHKTTQWEILYPQKGASLMEDYLYYNEKREATESSIANLVVYDGKKYFTPPISCGLLAGTFRNYLIAAGFIAEKILPLDSLPNYRKIYLINSVRGWRLARIHGW